MPMRGDIEMKEAHIKFVIDNENSIEEFDKLISDLMEKGISVNIDFSSKEEENE